MQIYENMLKLSLLCLGIIAVSMFFLSVGVLFSRWHTFRSQHIGHSAAMRRRGIHCVQSMDAIERRMADNPHRVREKKIETIS